MNDRGCSPNAEQPALHSRLVATPLRRQHKSRPNDTPTAPVRRRLAASGYRIRTVTCLSYTTRRRQQHQRLPLALAGFARSRPRRNRPSDCQFAPLRTPLLPPALAPGPPRTPERLALSRTITSGIPALKWLPPIRLSLGTKQPQRMLAHEPVVAPANPMSVPPTKRRPPAPPTR